MLWGNTSERRAGALRCTATLGTQSCPAPRGQGLQDSCHTEVRTAGCTYREHVLQPVGGQVPLQEALQQVFEGTEGVTVQYLGRKG